MTVRQPPRKRRARRVSGLLPQYVGYNSLRNIGEWKYTERIVDGPIDNSAMALFILNNMAQGSSASTRIGLKISVQSVELRWYSRATPFGGTDQVHRFWLFIDKQANGTLPLPNEYLLNPNTLAMRNLNYRKRFKTVMDRAYICNASAEPFDHKYNHVYIKFRKPLLVEYNNGNTGTIADIVSNSLIFGYVSNIAPGATAGQVYGNIRIRYTDN